jgi:CHAD domain
MRYSGESEGMAKKSTLEALTKDPRAQVVAAGAVASGGALAAGKLVRDRSERRRTRFRLHPDENAAEGLRRVARAQIDIASAQLEDGDDVAESVHEARKSFKRVRAVVRLARDPLGDDVYRRENAAFRDTGRELAAARSTTSSSAIAGRSTMARSPACARRSTPTPARRTTASPRTPGRSRRFGRASAPRTIESPHGRCPSTPARGCSRPASSASTSAAGGR